MSVDFKEYKAAFLEQNDLAHFGILGMKWGVRRYQNPDGTLTPAGKKRRDRLNAKMSKAMVDGKWTDKALEINRKRIKYGFETPEEKKKRLEEIDIINKEKEERKQRLEEKYTKMDPSEAKKYWDENAKDIFTEHDADKNPKRAEKAADLGLKALNRMGRDGYDEDEGITDNDRDWFIWEDQTIGLMTVADLALHGKNKEQIKKLMKAARDMDWDDDHYGNGVFQLAEASGASDEYLDAIFAILNSKGYL